MSLSPMDIRNKQFSTVRFRSGYDEEDVDVLLDRVESALRALDGEPHEGPLITADDVRETRLRSTLLAPGYRMDEVDDFLDRVVVELVGLGLSRS